MAHWEFFLKSNRSRDVPGRVYEYFLGQFARAEGRCGSEFYTPRTVVRLLVDMLQPCQVSWLRHSWIILCDRSNS